MDLFRRLQTPYYEEARRRFGKSEVRYQFSDSNEHYPYTQEVLQRIATDQIST